MWTHGQTYVATYATTYADTLGEIEAHDICNII